MEKFVIKHMTTRGKLHRQRAAVRYPVQVQSHGAGVEVVPFESFVHNGKPIPTMGIYLTTGDDPMTGAHQKRFLGTVLDTKDGPLWMIGPDNLGDILIASTHHVG